MVVWNPGTSVTRAHQLFWNLETACSFSESVHGKVFASIANDNGQFVRSREVKY